MAENELGGLALIAANYGADDQDPPENESSATHAPEERMEVEPTTTSQNGAQKSPQNTNNTNRARLSFKLTKGTSPVRRTSFTGSQAADPPTQSFNNSQIAPAPRKFLTYGDRTRSAPAVLTNHVAPFPGLDNLGNTCYINSVLQVLYHAKEFHTHLHTASSMNTTLFSTDTETAVGRPLFDGKNTRHVHIARDLIDQFLDLFREMDERYRKLSQLYSQHHELDLNTAICAAIVPRPLMKALGAIDPQFGPGTEQQDVQEFIRVVLGHLDDADKTCMKVFNEVENHIKRRKRSYSDMMSDVEENGHTTNAHEHNGNGHTNHGSENHNSTSNGDAPPFKKQRLDNGQNGSASNGTNHVNGQNGHSNGTTNGTTTPKYLSPLKKSMPSPAPETRLSYIERLFQGCSVNSIKCLECENVSARSENFLDLSLTIEKGQNLMWSIAQFASSEQLRGDNKYSCENCRTHTEAVKSTKFGALPRILTIHLKRFRHEMYSTEKVNHHIPSPFYLKLDQWCEKTCKEKNNIYELFGIIFHQGSSMSYGHYFSYLKIKRPTPGKGDDFESNPNNPSHIPGTDFFSAPMRNGSDNKEEHSWIHCDDETVTFKTEKEIMNLFNIESRSSSTAYILFYRSLDDQDLRCIDSAYLYKHLNKSKFRQEIDETESWLHQQTICYYLPSTSEQETLPVNLVRLHMAKLNRRTLFLRVEKILIKEEPENKSLDDKEVTKLAVTRYEKLADDVLEELTTLARECNDSDDTDAEVNKVIELFRKRRVKPAKASTAVKSDPPKEKAKEPEKKKEEVSKKDQDDKIKEKEDKVRAEDEKVRLKAEKLKAETERLRLALAKQKEEEERIKQTAMKKQEEERALKEKLKAKEAATEKVKTNTLTSKEEDRSKKDTSAKHDKEEERDKKDEKKLKEKLKDTKDKSDAKSTKNDEKVKQDSANASKVRDDEPKVKIKEKDREKEDMKHKEENKRQEEIERQNKLLQENEELKRLVRLKEEETERLRKEMEKKLALEKKELEKQIEQKLIQEKLLAEERLKRDLEETKNLLKKLTLENSSLKNHNTELLKKKRQYEDLNSNLRNEKMKLEDQSLKVEEKLKASEAEKALAEQKLSAIPLLTGKAQSVTLTRVKGVKHVVVDTSILIGRLFDLKFAVQNTSHVFVIPMQVTKELDNLKERKHSPQCQPARDAIRYLATQGRDKVRGQSVTEVMSPSALSEVAPESPDERILLCALYYQTYIADDVVLISDDNNMRARGALHYGLDVMSGFEFNSDVMKKANFAFSSSSDSVPKPRSTELSTSRTVSVSSSADSVPITKPKTFDTSNMNNNRPREPDSKPRPSHRSAPNHKSEGSKIGYASRQRLPEDKRRLLDNNLNSTWVPPVPNLTLPVVASGPRSTLFDTKCK